MAEDAEHVFFRCPRFEEERRELEELIGVKPEPETLVELMLMTEKNWASASSFARTVMTELRKEEEKRREEKREIEGNSDAYFLNMYEVDRVPIVVEEPEG